MTVWSGLGGRRVTTHGTVTHVNAPPVLWNGMIQTSSQRLLPTDRDSHAFGGFFRPAALAIALLVASGGSFGSGASQAQEYVPALSLIADTAAGVVRIPSVPELCEAWKTTTLASLTQDPLMQPFIELQRKRSEERVGALGFNVGLRPRDVLEMASGEAVVAWLPYRDVRRPFALALIADIRGRRAQADQVIAQVDTDLRAAGATLREAPYGDEKVLIYTLRPTPGQIKIEQVVITINDTRVIATDRDSLVYAMLDAVAGRDEQPKIDQLPAFTGIQQQIAAAPVAGEQPAAEAAAGDGDAASAARVEWFARPLAMGRIVKEAVRVDRGQQVDVLNLLERQGFDTIEAVGGHLTVGHAQYDLLHNGFVWAPAAPGQQERFRLAARMLPTDNAEARPVPQWVGKTIATFTRLNWNLGDAFWHAESLINDAFGEEIFRDILDGIRDDQDGPRIDLAKDVLPNLGTQVIILTDNVMPADARSERMLVAVETTNAVAVRQAVRQAMEVEPDATLIPSGIAGVDVYRVLRTDEPSDFEAELFDDLGLGADLDSEAPPPLLNQWAITVIEDQAAGASSGSGYLMFSSHPELLLETIGRIGTPAADGFGDQPDVQAVSEQLLALGGSERMFERIARTNLALRAKYVLAREGRLRDSDSILATLFRRIFEAQEEVRDDLGTDQLPPFEQIEKYFRPAGGVSRATEQGWTLDGFLMK